jgi:rare lipoprotein A
MRKEPVMNKTIFIWLLFFCLTQLVACSFVGRNVSSSSTDGAPKVDIDASKIHDAVPKKEKKSPYANSSYRIRGHYYKVLKTAHNYDKVGTASWYGTNFHGKRTSTMERYNLYSMTAASTELPLPTYVKVTNLSNGKHVIVKVNDRGPFEQNRLIDLSYAAAKKLDFIDSGVARVRVTAIDPGTWDGEKKSKPVYLASNVEKAKKPVEKLPEVIAESTALVKKPVEVAEAATLTSKVENNLEKLYLQVGAFASLMSAQKLSQKIYALVHIDTHVNTVSGADDNPLYKVQIGPLYSSAETDRIRSMLRDNGIGEAVTIKG